MRFRAFAAVAAFVLLSAPTFAHDPAGARDSGTAHRYGSAIAGAIQSNAVVFSFNYFVSQTEYSKVTPGSIQRNLSSEWEWDQSEYPTNQLGHPYQGSTYFAAGRSNGLGFYDSALITCFGSANWELFCESYKPSLNDLIQTTIGGAVFGEVLHRLYLEAASTGSPLAVFVSPVDALNMWINDASPDARGGNIRELAVVSGLGFASSTRTEDGRNCPSDVTNTPTLASGIAIVYGDAFGTEVSEPFEQFDLDIRLSGGLYRYECSIFSDGTLASWAPFDERNALTSVGIALNFDCMFTDNVRFTSNALSATIRRERAITRSLTSRASAYAGWMMLGVGTFYERESRHAAKEEGATLNYGTGAAAKCSYILDHDRLGSVEIGTKLYAMRIFPGSADKADGTLFCGVFETRVARPVTRRATLFARGTYTRERCVPDTAPNQLRQTGDATVGMQWSVN